VNQGEHVSQPEVPLISPPQGESVGESGTRPRGELRLRLFAKTDVGQIREHNEDNFLVADLSRRTRGVMDAQKGFQMGPQGALFAVCDGMGGAAAGEIASQLAVDILYEKMIDGLPTEKAVPRVDMARRLVRAVEAAGLRIF
jgi:protein phosphatase